MKRAIPIALSAALLLGAAPALASDGSLERALGPYKSRLTSDIAYLAGFSAPSRSAAGATLSRLTGIANDLSRAIRAANGQRPSTHSGSRGKALVISALDDALNAVGDARASANAARAGRGASARSDARAELSQINRAIPLFEQGGRLLHLF